MQGFCVSTINFSKQECYISDWNITHLQKLNL